MREFFKGWRRKAGCVALVMALVLSGIWVRSRFTADEVLFAFNGRVHNLTTIDGQFFWLSVIGTPPERNWTTFRPSDMPIEQRRRFFDAMRAFPGGVGLNCRLGFFIIPLTLLSAYLILWKPRKRMGSDHA